MSIATKRISQLILDELAHGEMRLLVLVVAIRKGLDRSEGIKGDLSAAVKSALRKLVAAKAVTDVEGVYGLATPIIPRTSDHSLMSSGMIHQHA